MSSGYIQLSSVAKYINAIASPTSNEHTVQAAYSGVILADMLKHMDIECGLKQPMTYMDSFQNLKAVHEEIHRLAIQHQLYNIIEQQIDLLEISKNRNQKEMCRLFLCCLAIGLQSHKKEYFISKMLKLEESVQTEFVLGLNPLMEKGLRKTDQTIMLHKITQLQTENNRLQSIIKEDIREQEQLRTIICLLQEQVSTYRNISNTQESDEVVSPKYHRDLSEKKCFTPIRSQAKSLVGRYQTQISSLECELELYKLSEARLISHKQQLQCLKRKYQESNLQQMELKSKTYMDTIDSKNRQIVLLDQQMKQMNWKTSELEKVNSLQSVELQSGMDRNLQLTRQLQQLRLMFKDQEEKLEEREPLSEICPEVNLELNGIKEQNQSLLIGLQKSTTKMRALEREIHRYKSENIRLLQLEAENKKLQSTLAEYQQSRGEETDILVGCLYELRAKMKNLHPSSTVVNSERGPELNR